MSLATIAIAGLAAAGGEALGKSKVDMPDMPPPPSPPPTEVDVDPTKEETRKRLRKSAAANTLMTGEMLDAPTVMKPRL